MLSPQEMKTVREYFHSYDTNNNGTLCIRELRNVFTCLSQEEFTLMFKAIDKNGNGRIECDEFVDWVMAEKSGRADAVSQNFPKKKASIPGVRIALDYKSLLPERFEVDITQRYTLDKTTLGEGGYGQVFVAKDRQFENRVVVVKKVTKTGDSSRTELFRREIEIMKKLDHPHICKLLATFEEGNSIFYVMEYLEGGELFDRIIEQRGISEQGTAKIIGQVANAIQYAHGRKIVHRDIKPENVVFCTKNGDSVKLIDWGFGMSFLDCVMKEPVGSTTYMAPEVMDSGNVRAYSEACDIWSLGVLTYVTLYGKPPFWGSRKAHLDNARAEKYPFPEGASSQAKDFIRMLLKAKPADRLRIDQVGQHPWLTATEWQIPNDNQLSNVLTNFQKFANQSTFSAMCTVSVARQLDHKKLSEIHNVFRAMDVNNDGVLSLEEIKAGFSKVYGESSEEATLAEETFTALDVDGSGTIDYTEFCAAGLAHHTILQDEACWAAFHSFDVDNTGTISMDDIRKVMAKADVKGLWSEDVCGDVVEQLLKNHDQNGDGSIDFSEFMAMMKSCRESVDPIADENDEAPTHSSDSLRLNAYELLRNKAFLPRTRIATDYKTLLPQRFDVDISKRYTLDKTTLGEGGYGQVFVAKDRRFENRVVVVKKVTKTGDSSRTELFTREIEIMMELDHPHICKLLGTFEEGSSIFYVMEYLEGGELFDRIINEKAISERTTAKIIGQVANALHYANGCKIVHRDIKPENVVFCTKGGDSVKLIDWGFGISFIDCVMKDSVGSRTYMAPEVMDSRNTKAYSEACDLWSLGVLTYVTLYGRPPFWGSQRSHLENARAERYPMTGQFWEKVSPEAKDFIKKLLKANPADRLPINQVEKHPWLTATEWPQPGDDYVAAVLKNMKNFNQKSTFSAMCITAVARQLDHTKLTEIHQMFRIMDKNNDGVLSFEEIKAGFTKFYGEDSEESILALETFKGMDIDGSGAVDYTEFCAAGLGHHTVLQEEACWAAFHSFDVDNTGTISMDDLKKVLAKGDLQGLWSDDVCGDVAEQVIAKHDKNNDGSIDFAEFMAMMHESRDSLDPLYDANVDEKTKASLEGGSRLDSYDLLLALPLQPGKRVATQYKTLLPERFEVDIRKRYTLDKTTLGEGGYGQVFVAKDRDFENRIVVVKKVTKTGDKTRNDLFKKEIEIMKELDHPHICKLLGTYEEGNSIFYVMEYLEGGELFDRIIKDGKVSEEKTATIIRQVVNALHYAHGRNIVHRDIKPENIVFCTRKGDSVKLIDWGFGVSFLDCVMKESVGSTTYMAPEVMVANNAKAYGEACDLWSVGVLTYVTLYGRPPFWGSQKAHLESAMHERYPMTGQFWELVSSDAKDFIKKLLKAKPEDRLPMNKLEEHPWLTATEWPEPHNDQMVGALKNLRNFSNTSTFTAMCTAAVARQLDHNKLGDIHQVFRTMDKNNDGVLSLEEIKAGFSKIYGENSEEYNLAFDIFKGLDLDGSEVIDYTEFCAGGLGHHTVLQEEACWAAFHSFDVDGTGTISADDLQAVLGKADMKGLWSEQVCTDVTKQVFAKHDKDGDGTIDFKEFMAMMSSNSGDPLAGITEEAEAQFRKYDCRR